MEMIQVFLLRTTKRWDIINKLGLFDVLVAFDNPKGMTIYKQRQSRALKVIFHLPLGQIEI